MPQSTTPQKTETSYEVEHTPEGNPFIKLITPSTTTPIYLTKLYPTDAPTLKTIFSLPEIYNFLHGNPHPYTLADAEFWISLQQSGKSNLSLQALRAGHPGPEGELIGSCSLMPQDGEASRGLVVFDGEVGGGEGREVGRRGDVVLGYYLHPGWRGRGIMREGIRALLWWGRERVESGGGRVVVSILRENGGSRGVVEGMNREIGIGDGEEGVRGWKRLVERGGWIDWPESKGGGRRELWVWEWSY